MASKRSQGRAWKGEKLYLLSELSKQALPVDYGYETFRRWARHGVRVGSRRVRLETVEINGRMHSSVEAVCDVIDRIAQAQQFGGA